MLDKLKKDCDGLYASIYNYLSATSGKFRSDSTSSLVDSGFLCREIENQLDELRKLVKARKEFINKVLVLTAHQDMVSGGDGKLSGTLATASPDTKVVPKVPNKGTKEYNDLLEYFGVKDDMDGVIGIKFNNLKEHLTKLMGEGKKLPVEETFTEFNVVYRRKQRGA